jgi:hypothetical protein
VVRLGNGSAARNDRRYATLLAGEAPVPTTAEPETIIDCRDAAESAGLSYRKCYVHPEVVNAYLDGGRLLEVRQTIDDELRGELVSLRPEEAAVLAFLRTRVSREIDAGRAIAAAPRPDAAPTRRQRASRLTPTASRAPAGEARRNAGSKHA